MLPLARALSLWFRRASTPRLNRLVWYGLCRSYLNRRLTRVRAVTRFGDKFDCDLEDVIQAYVFYFGIWEPDISAYIRSTIGADDVFVDVGANIGYHTISIARMAAKVVSIEASPTIFRRLNDNISLNNAGNVRAINVAAGEHRDHAPIYAGPSRNSGMTTLIRDDRARLPGDAPRAFVDCRPLSTLLDHDEKKAARIIKIDIEGGEYPVLHDIFEHRDDFAPSLEIVTEFSASRCIKYGVTIGAFTKEAEAAGFRLYVLPNDYDVRNYLRPAPVQRPRRVAALGSGQFDLVLSPRDREAL